MYGFGIGQFQTSLQGKTHSAPQKQHLWYVSFQKNLTELKPSPDSEAQLTPYKTRHAFLPLTAFPAYSKTRKSWFDFVMCVSVFECKKLAVVCGL